MSNQLKGGKTAFKNKVEIYCFRRNKNKFATETMDFLSNKSETSRLFLGLILILINRALCYEQEAVEKGMNIMNILYIQNEPPLNIKDTP